MEYNLEVVVELEGWVAHLGIILLVVAIGDAELTGQMGCRFQLFPNLLSSRTLITPRVLISSALRCSGFSERLTAR